MGSTAVAISMIHREMAAYLVNHLAREPVNDRNSAREKLARLTRQKLQDLSTDFCDELLRRKKKDEGFPFLPFRDDYHPKRNQARQKLASLSETRFMDFGGVLFHEMGRRYPEVIKSESLKNENESTSVDDNRLEELPELPQPLRAVLNRIPHFNLTGKIRYHSATTGNANGGSCDIFIGSFLGGHRIGAIKKLAVKRIRTHINYDTNFSKYIARELYIWSNLKHDNVLLFLGYVQDGVYPCFVSEWIENGSLAHLLHHSPMIPPITRNDVGKRIIIGIARGLSYLHESNVVHSDIKPDNILISLSGEPLLCDFGISRILVATQTFDTTTVNGPVRGSTRWMAPELLNMDDPKLQSMQSDVWAFGMTLYELLSGKLPYSQYMHDIQVMFAILRFDLPCERLPPSRELGADLPLWSICQLCWEKNGDMRPNSHSIREAIEEHFSDSSS